MNKTPIEWVKNPDGTQGYTWNPITGCLNDCEYCYARKLANGRLKSRYLANENIAGKPLWVNSYGDEYQLVNKREPFYPRFWEDRFDEMTPFNHEKKPKGIFVCDMSDLFGIGIPEEWTRRVFETINDHPEHRFYLLTKQPQNLIKWSPFPPHVYCGVTATNTKMAEIAIYYLRQIEATVKYISFEPLLEPIVRWVGDAEYLFKYLNWVIIGAQTGRDYWGLSAQLYHSTDTTASRIQRYGRGWTLQPKIEWVQEIVESCDKAGVAVFLKDNLESLWALENRRETFFKFSRPSVGATEVGKLRQELPK